MKLPIQNYTRCAVTQQQAPSVICHDQTGPLLSAMLSASTATSPVITFGFPAHRHISLLWNLALEFRVQLCINLSPRNIGNPRWGGEIVQRQITCGYAATWLCGTRGSSLRCGSISQGKNPKIFLIIVYIVGRAIVKNGPRKSNFISKDVYFDSEQKKSHPLNLWIYESARVRARENFLQSAIKKETFPTSCDCLGTRVERTCRC